MQTIIATCPAWPQGNADLRALAAALDAALIPWPEIFPGPAVILPLAVWDYSTDPAAYCRWLHEQVKAGAYFINSPALQIWNMDKRYLCELAAQGLAVTPGMALVPGDDWAARIAASGWDNPVIKPLIGQSGRGVRRLAAGLPHLADYPQGMLVQPFIDAPFGEVCLVYIAGHYSHAAHRRPAAGEWRANSAYGVDILPIEPEAAWRARAQAALAALPEHPAYARVDGLITADGDYLINEIELIEPALYLAQNPTAITAFTRLIQKVALNI